MALFSRFAKKIGSSATGSNVSFPLILKEAAREEGRYAIWIRNHGWNARVEAWCRLRMEKFTYRPTVGILMECKNPKEEFMRESLSSILNQLYPFHELSIVDRGSTDSKIPHLLEEVGKDPRVKVSFQKGTERDVEAIAKIMKKAVSEWILLMGAEDILEPNAIYNMVATLQDTAEIDFVFSDSDLIDDQGLRFDPQFKPVWAVGAHYPEGFYQHPVLLHDRLVRKLRGHERISALMEEGTLLDEASNHSRYVLKARGILHHARARGRKNENPPEPVDNVLMNDNLLVENGTIQIDILARQRAEPKVPLKILWCIDSLDHDDGPMVWYHYVRYLTSESKHEFVVVSLQDGPMRANYEKICPVHVVLENQNEISEKISFLHQKHRFDVSFVSSVENFWFPEVLPELGIPTLWQLYPGKQQEAAVASEDLRKRFRYPATIVFLNSAIERTYKHFDTAGVSRILPTGIDLANLKTFKQRNSPFEFRDRLGIQQSSTVFVLAGSTIERKQQHVFVQAAFKVLNRNPGKELDFFIVGGRPGPYLGQLKRMIDESGNSKHFHLVPEAGDPFQYYPYCLIADVCISCSREETFPLTTLEAMAMKKAVIGTRVFSTNEVIEDNKNGYLVTTGDSSKLAERMDFLINKPEIRDFYGRRSLEIIYEKFHFRKIATRLEDLLRESIAY